MTKTTIVRCASCELFRCAYPANCPNCVFLQPASPGQMRWWHLVAVAPHCPQQYSQGVGSEFLNCILYKTVPCALYFQDSLLYGTMRLSTSDQQFTSCPSAYRRERDRPLLSSLVSRAGLQASRASFRPPSPGMVLECLLPRDAISPPPCPRACSSSPSEAASLPDALSSLCGLGKCKITPQAGQYVHFFATRVPQSVQYHHRRSLERWHLHLVGAILADHSHARDRPGATIWKTVTR